MKQTCALLCVLVICGGMHAQVKINEVYGGGGNTGGGGAPWRNDFIELYNPTGSAVSLAGWSVQYTSATGPTTTWSVTALSGTIAPNGYYLVQQGSGGTAGVVLPAPDATGSIAMSATAGKVILCNTTTAQTVSNPTGAAIIDKVGYGTTANGFEGSGPAPAPSNTTSVQRTAPGLDTDNNNTDFAVLNPPTPTNGGIDVTPPAISTLSPANAATGVAPSLLAVIGFSETVQKGTGNIIIKKTSDNSAVLTLDVTTAAVTVSGSTANFLMQPLEFNMGYYVEITAGAFKDNANNNFGGITGSAAWSFTVTPQPTGTAGITYNFNTCTNYLFGGVFTQYSAAGAQLWACTSFGRDAANPPLGSAPDGMQVNGFSGTNIPNKDWLISPAFDLTGTTYPLLSFWSRTRFNGDPLKLKVSTTYPGWGNPDNYTWADLNGKFPAQTSDTWVLSENINLTAYKSASTYFAFVYNSTDDDGARWTVDDITITNSAVPPPPSLTISTADIQFGYTAAGGGAVKPFTVTGNDITGDITLAVTGVFGLSTSAGGPFTPTLILPQSGANNTPIIVYVQYAPTVNDVNNGGTITISTPSVTSQAVNVRGTSIDPAKTLEVVNWNIEWFGSPANGPANDAQQQANVQTILQNIGADVYALCEVVDETRLAAVVGNMPGYSYVISNFGSHTNPNSPTPSPLNTAQKLAFVYKTSVLSNIITQPLLSQGINSAADISNPAYNYFSSGRFPYMLTADVTLNGVTRTIRFVLVHAKANTSPTATSYARRKSSSDTLHFTLNSLYPADNIIVLGDFNDDLDQTVTDGIVPPTTSYSAFTGNAANYPSPTLALSLAGKKSTVGFNDMIDHVVLSDEMNQYYMNSTANVLDDVTSLVTNYATTTTDHYPIFTRYAFDATILPVRLISFSAAREAESVRLLWTTANEQNLASFIVERRINNGGWQAIATVPAGGNNTGATAAYNIIDNNPLPGYNHYRLKSVDANGLYSYSLTRSVQFGKTGIYTVYPNPVQQQLTVSVNNDNGLNGRAEIFSQSGQQLLSLNITGRLVQLNITGLQAGMYLLKLTAADGTVQVSRVVKE